MTDCGCEKARRDLEEYLRHEVCKTEQSDIAEHLAHCAECTRRGARRADADRGHRAGVQGDRARGAARPGARDAARGPGDALTASGRATQAGGAKTVSGARHDVDRQRQRADRVAVRIGGDARRARAAPSATRRIDDLGARRRACPCRRAAAAAAAAGARRGARASRRAGRRRGRHPGRSGCRRRTCGRCRPSPSRGRRRCARACRRRGRARPRTGCRASLRNSTRIAML